MPGALTLQQYAAAVRMTVASNRNLQNRWVAAELSDVRLRGGHCYLELVEKNDSGQLVAKMRAAIWASYYSRIRAKFVSATGRELTGGIKLMVCGTASYHECYGLTFNVIDIDPTYTLGDIERQRREILQALTRKGIIGLNKTRAIPVAPQRIAVISASGAAGYGDFMNQLHKNPYGIVFYPVLFEAVMQGERTALTICNALRRIRQTADRWDMVVIIRGGGASTDLHGFDNLALAEAIASFPLPVMVGIGHERDRTVLDEIACVRVKTPTAAAEWLVTVCGDVLAKIDNLTRMIVDEARERLKGAQQQTAWLATQIVSSASAGIHSANARIDALSTLIPALVSNRIGNASERLRSLAVIIPQTVGSRTAAIRARLDMTPRIIREAVRVNIRRASERIDNLDKVVGVLSPDNTLRRGYSLTLCGGKIVKNIEAVAPGQTIITRLPDGTISSTIIEKHPGK